MTIHNSIFIVLLVGLVIMGGFIFINKNSYFANQLTSVIMNDKSSSGSDEEVTPLKKGISFKLNPTDSDFGQSGVVKVEEINGNIRIILDLTDNSKITNVQPVYINSGTCAQPKKTIFQLNNLINGHSETNIDMSLLDFQKRLPLVLNVYKSDNDARISTSCVELKNKI